jgi:S1-C subfamily serine protease
VVAGSPAARALREGDLLLAVDGAPVNRFRDVERAAQAEKVSLTIVRDGKESVTEVATVAIGLDETTRVVLWSGALLAKPHRVVAAQRALPREGVFVGYYSFGSPASRYGLTPGRRIVAVDDQPTPDLDAFLKVVAGKLHRDPVRLKTITWSGAVEVITLKTDLKYYPTLDLARNGGGEWSRTDR